MSERSPNVFVLTVDSLRFDAYDEFMDEVRSLVEGVEFTNAVATANATGSSMPAIAAGVYADRVACGTPNLKLGETSKEDGLTTMAEVLSRSGYDCWLWSDNVIFGSARHFDRGFEGGRTGTPSWKKRAQKLIQRTGSDRLFNAGRWVYFNAIGPVRDRLPAGGTYYPTAREYHRSVLESLERESGGQMHWIHYMDVHHPFEPPVEYLESRSFHTERSSSRLAELSSMAIIENRGERASDEDIEDIEQSYLACVEHLRDELVDFFKTLIDGDHFVPGHDVLVLTSDHGEGFDRETHGMLGHTPTPAFWEDLVRVPLLVSHPGWEPDTVDCQVSLIDFMPTVLGAVGAEVPDSVDGTAATRPDDMHREYAYFTGTGPYRTYHGIRSESGWKLFSDRISDSETVEVNGMDESADRERILLTRVDEPGESVRFECDLDANARPSSDPERARWRELYTRLTDEKGDVASRRFDAAMTDETVEQLRSLGYVDNIRQA